MPEVMQVYDTVKKDYFPLTVENGILPVPKTSIYGNYPERDYIDINGNLAASATATLFESNDISAFSSMAIYLSSITVGDNVKAYVSYDGTTFSSGTINLAWRNLTTDAVIAGTTGLTAAGLYSLVLNAGPMKYRKIRLTYTAATTGSVAFTGGIW